MNSIQENHQAESKQALLCLDIMLSLITISTVLFCTIVSLLQLVEICTKESKINIHKYVPILFLIYYRFTFQYWDIQSSYGKCCSFIRIIFLYIT